MNKVTIIEDDSKITAYLKSYIEKYNYVVLAVKYTADRSKRLDITVSKQAGAAVLAITDYGVGIPAHDLKRLFQAFYTDDNGRVFRESTGMGLYITKEVTHYLGPQIEVESTVDVGTTFRLCFTKAQTIE